MHGSVLSVKLCGKDIDFLTINVKCRATEDTFALQWTTSQGTALHKQMHSRTSPQKKLPCESLNIMTEAEKLMDIER